MSTLKLVPSLTSTPEPMALKPWTVQDYHRMGELGVLAAGERTELIAGQVLLMAAKGTPHVTALQLLANALRDRLGSGALIRTQDPIRLDDFSEPEPDLAVVRGQVLDYADRHPSPIEVQLLVEVADSTVRQDCGIKAKLYALANISEYWVLDLPGRQLHVFQQPGETGYGRQILLQESAQVSPIAFPEITLAVQAILPPA
jgi:Uma2 family endonuclease